LGRALRRVLSAHVGASSIPRSSPPPGLGAPPDPPRARLAFLGDGCGDRHLPPPPSGPWR